MIRVTMKEKRSNKNLTGHKTRADGPTRGNRTYRRQQHQTRAQKLHQGPTPQQHRREKSEGRRPPSLGCQERLGRHPLCHSLSSQSPSRRGAGVGERCRGGMGRSPAAGVCLGLAPVRDASDVEGSWDGPADNGCSSSSLGFFVMGLRRGRRGAGERVPLARVRSGGSGRLGAVPWSSLAAVWAVGCPCVPECVLAVRTWGCRCPWASCASESL